MSQQSFIQWSSNRTLSPCLHLDRLSRWESVPIILFGISLTRAEAKVFGEALALEVDPLALSAAMVALHRFPMREVHR